ncbi:Beta-catenin-like protein 1 [Desmophyllum pertusum]|uniref:Beta-catenin-like protein 1 n=1 Tax=Desmophyllum pertusum TaxID=174260 RepID=A0A9X0D3A9_9CNID|nr:Beta-catenin-like protein 1 [Desmophyllum pertusum]
MNVAELLAFQPERGTKRKKEGNADQQPNDSKKRPIAADLQTGSGLSEEERLKILEMVDNEPEVSIQFQIEF